MLSICLSSSMYLDKIKEARTTQISYSKVSLKFLFMRSAVNWFALHFLIVYVCSHFWFFSSHPTISSNTLPPQQFYNTIIVNYKILASEKLPWLSGSTNCIKDLAKQNGFNCITKLNRYLIVSPRCICHQTESSLFFW